LVALGFENQVLESSVGVEELNTAEELGKAVRLSEGQTERQMDSLVQKVHSAAERSPVEPGQAAEEGKASQGMGCLVY
jgi:hypothetical protein